MKAAYIIQFGLLILVLNACGRDSYSCSQDFKKNITIQVEGEIEDVGFDAIHHRTVKFIENDLIKGEIQLTNSEYPEFYIHEFYHEGLKRKLIIISGKDNQQLTVLDAESYTVTREFDLRLKKEMFVNSEKIEFGNCPHIYKL